MVTKSGEKRILRSATRAAEQEITDVDAPVEVVEEPTAKAPLAAQAAAPRPRRPRGRKTSSTHPPSRSPSHNSTERRLLTQMEREDAKARADELQERLEGSWNSREVIRETRAQIKNLRAIEAGQHVDSSPPTQKVKQPATRKRPARKAEDHNEPSDMNGFGERPNEIAYLERRQQAWRDQHPELFRIRTRPPPAHLLPETTPPTSGSDSDSDYPGGRVRKRRRKQKDQEENEEEDYGALEQFNGELTVDRPAKSKRGNPPTQSVSTPPHPRPGDPIYSLYAQPSVPVAQPQPVTAHPSQPQPRAQLQAQTSFDQRLALIAQGIAIPPHHYPPGSAPSPHAPTSNLPASDLLRPRPAIAAEQPTPLFGHIPTIAGRDIVIGLSMRGNIALDQAVRYEPDAEDAGEEGAKEAP